MANIQVGGKLARNGRFRIERPFVGVIAGFSVNRLRVLDLAAERDPHVTVRGDVQLVTGVLDRNDLQRMQQVRITHEITLIHIYSFHLFLCFFPTLFTLFLSISIEFVLHSTTFACNSKENSCKFTIFDKDFVRSCCSIFVVLSVPDFALSSFWIRLRRKAFYACLAKVFFSIIFHSHTQIPRNVHTHTHAHNQLLETTYSIKTLLKRNEHKHEFSPNHFRFSVSILFS